MGSRYSVPLQVRVDPGTYELAKQLARERLLTVSALVRRLLVEEAVRPRIPPVSKPEQSWPIRT